MEDNGADGGVRASERKVALKYFAGSTASPANAVYGDSDGTGGRYSGADNILRGDKTFVFYRPTRSIGVELLIRAGNPVYRFDLQVFDIRFDCMSIVSKKSPKIFVVMIPGKFFLPQ